MTLLDVEDTICPVCEHAAIGGATHPQCKKEKGIDGLTSLFRYNGVVKKAIKTIKYRYTTAIVKEVIFTVTPTSYNFSREVDALIDPVFIPIPLHAQKFRFRGFNQAQIIAHEISHSIKIPVRTGVATRVRDTKSQVDMPDRVARIHNLSNAFAVDVRAVRTLQSAIVVDDVFTTGATMRAMAKVLKEAGVPFVWGLTLAR
jgi:ComF family protein